MIVLALDTSTRSGSVALARDGVIVAEQAGDASITHGQRLPGEIVSILEAHRVRLADIDLYGIVAGPGSFTGLRVGMATIQGLAFVHRRRMVPVSSLEALAHAARPFAGHEDLIAAWMDAHRQEVFAALYRYRDGQIVEVAGPAVGGADDILEQWKAWRHEPVWFVGDGVTGRQSAIELLGPNAHVVETVPALAGIVARLAGERAGQAVEPGEVRPLYVRRPDAELTRDRHAGKER